MQTAHAERQVAAYAALAGWCSSSSLVAELADLHTGPHVRLWTHQNSKSNLVATVRFTFTVCAFFCLYMTIHLVVAAYA